MSHKRRRRISVTEILDQPTTRQLRMTTDLMNGHAKTVHQTLAYPKETRPRVKEQKSGSQQTALHIVCWARLGNT